MENHEQDHDLVSPHISEVHLGVVRRTVPTAVGKTTGCTCADCVVVVHESSYPSCMMSHANATRRSDAVTRGWEVHAPAAHVKSPRREQNTVCFEMNTRHELVLTGPPPPPHPAYPSLPLGAALAQHGFWESSTLLTSELSLGSYEPASTPQHGRPWEHLSIEASHTQNADSVGHIGNAALGTSLFSPAANLPPTSTSSTDIGDPVEFSFSALIEDNGTQSHSFTQQRWPPRSQLAFSYDAGASVISPYHAEISTGRSPQAMSVEERMNVFGVTRPDPQHELRCPEAESATHFALFGGSVQCGENGMQEMAWSLQQDQSGQIPSHYPLPTMQRNSSNEILMTRIGWGPDPQSDILAEAFTETSHHPSPALRTLLDDVRNSSFVLGHVQEPSIADIYSIGVLAKIVDLPGCPSIKLGNLQRSLLTVFVDSSEYRCLFCGSCKSSLARALGCVRVHLGHRPFGCTGCDSCTILNGYARFSTSALLKDHLNGQQKKMECIRWWVSWEHRVYCT